MTEQDIEKGLEAIEVKIFKPIDSSILTNRRKGTYTDLLDSGATPLNISIKKQGRELEFEEPVFIISAFFDSASNSAPSLEIKYKNLESKLVTVSDNNKIKGDKILEVFISNVVKSITLAPEGLINFKEHLSKITLIGVKLNGLSDVVSDVTKKHKELEGLKTVVQGLIHQSNTKKQELSDKEKAFDQKIASHQTQIQNDEKKITELNEKIKAIEADSAKCESELDDLKEEIEGREKKISELDKKEETVKSNVLQLETKRDDLNVELAKSDTRLKKLQNDVNAYSENISDYIKEARKQSFVYTVLLGLALWGLGRLGYELVLKINDLIEYYIGLNTITQGQTRAIDFLLLRAPMALIVSFFIYLFSNVVNKLVQKIIHINDVKKELIAASIIAREVVESSAEGLQMTSKEIYDLKEILKLDFLTHTMFSSHAEAAKEAKKRRLGFLESLKFKLNDRITGTSIEGGVKASPDSE